MDIKRVLEFCRTVDVMLFFETPFDWRLIEECKRIGVRTALMPMHECMPVSHPQADITICPSPLDLQAYPDGVFLPVPVEDSIRAGWRLRERAEVFVHNAGHGGLRGRNGTAELIAAWEYVRSPVKLIVRAQHDIVVLSGRNVAGGRLDVRPGTCPRECLYMTGDVFVFPEKFNGLSLPMQEAYASGMPVMGTRRFPMDLWLPNDLLIPVDGYKRAKIGPPYREFLEAVVDPRKIAEHIDSWFGRDIRGYSALGKALAEQTSWEKLRPRYLEVLQ
jgi:hypothetical protein